jgi:hypothetical protein
MSWHLFGKPLLYGAIASTLIVALPLQAQSLVPNYDFEIDADSSGNPDLWFSGGTVGYVTSDDSDGVGTSSVSSQNGGDWRSQAFPALPLQTFEFSFDYKVSQGATGSARADLRFFTTLAGDGGTTGNFVGEFVHNIDAAAVPQGVWNSVGPFTVTVPAGNPPPLVIPTVGDVRLSAGLFGPALNGTIQWDNVRVRIPEPASASMLGGALLCMALLRRRNVA